MNIFNKVAVICSFIAIPFTMMGVSPKRGISWQQGANNLNSHHASLLSEGVSWVYNWGPDAENASVYNEDFYFVPMAWNGYYDANRIRTWLKNHPETKYLLGFNEPNFADQAAMTPAQAVAKWPDLEAMAQEFGVKLVAPALNFSGSAVGGKYWGIYEWYDEFFRLYPNAKVDCLALHCYMNWYSALQWFALDYFYKDLYNPSNENYGKYPNLVKFLDNFKNTNGHFPRMMLTEFCAWEYDGFLTGVDFQIDQMTQKVQKLEQSDLVEGYAWFMGNAGNANDFPYMSVFQTNTSTSGLSELGKVYVHMSDFDKSRYYSPGETIAAKDYVEATMDNQQIKLRSNTDSESKIALQIEMPANGQTDYLINLTQAGTYQLDCRVKSTANSTLTLYSDNNNIGQVTVSNSNGNWQNRQLMVQLPAGKHTLKIRNTGGSTIYLTAFQINSSTGVENIVTESAESNEILEVFTLQGTRVNSSNIDTLPAGIYLLRMKDGRTLKICR